VAFCLVGDSIVLHRKFFDRWVGTGFGEVQEVESHCDDTVRESKLANGYCEIVMKREYLEYFVDLLIDLGSIFMMMLIFVDPSSKNMLQSEMQI